MTNLTLEQRLQEPSQAREAFTEAIAAFSERLYWVIRRMVNNHDDANDLLQNTFMRAWQSLEMFRGDAKLSTWLHKIAINESLTFLERERKRLALSVDDPDARLADTIEADEWTDGDELKKKLRIAISQLPDKQRLVFNMRYFDEMPYEEMSEILGTSVGALKASYHLATKKIEKFFLPDD